MITVLPVTRAATVMPVRMASGKFHGAMTTATPRGAIVSSSFSSPGTIAATARHQAERLRRA